MPINIDHTKNQILTSDDQLEFRMTGSMIVPTGTTAQRPSTPSAGMMRYNTSLSTLEVYTSSWQDALAAGGGGASVTVSDTPPPTPGEGDLWWNSTDGILYVYYDDGTSSQWVTTASGGSGSGGGASVTVSDVQPVSPNEGDLWWDNTNLILYIYYDAVWVDTAGGGVGSLSQLGDVDITAPVNGALLAYNTTGSVWEDVGTFASQFDTALSNSVQGALAETALQPGDLFATPYEYGAVGNGVADDTAAVQSALNSGKPNVFLDGIFLISSPLSMTAVNLFGTGTLKATPAISSGGLEIGQTLLDGSTLSNFTIDGITFDFSGQTTILASTSCVNMRGCSDYTIKNCYFLSTGAATRAIGCSRYQIINNYYEYSNALGDFNGDAVIDNWASSNDGIISNNIILGGGQAEIGIIVTGQNSLLDPAGCDRFIISNNTVRNVQNAAIMFHGRDGINNDAVISDNLIEDSDLNGILIADCYNVTVNGNTVKNTGQSGIRAYSETAQGGVTGVRNSSIVGNAIRNANTTATANVPAIEIESSGTTEIVIAGNVISGNTHISGIRLRADVTNISTIGNTYSGSAMTAEVQNNSGNTSNRIEKDIIYTADYNDLVNLPTLYTSSNFDTDFSSKSTTDLSEGTNLYFTDERVDDRVAGLLVAGTDISLTYNDVANTLTIAYTGAGGGAATLDDLTDVTITAAATGEVLRYNGSAWVDATLSTSDVTEGTNLYYTQGRFDSAFSAKSTTDLTEGANLYFNNERVDDRVANLLVAGTDISLTYNDLLNTLTIAYTGSGGGATTLNELTDVTITTPVNGALLAYNTTGSIWEDVGTFASQFDTALATKSTTNLTEGTNLYYTQGRFDSAFTAKSTTDLSEGTNLYYTTARQNTDFDTRLATKSTTDLSEGTNLYYTNARVDTRIGLANINDLADVTITTPVNGALLTYNTTGSIWEDSGTFASQFDTALATKTTTNLTEGTNLYYTTARQNTDFDTRLATKSTTDLAEGTNLYYTQGRFDSAFTAKSTTDLSEGTNLYYTQGRFDSAFTAKSTTDLSEGTNLYFTDERVDDRVAALLVAGTDISLTYDDGANTLTIAYTGSAGATTLGGLTDVTLTTPVNGALLAYNTTGSIWEDVGTFASQFDTALATKTTTNLTEGTNLYYTTTRANSAIDTRVNKAFIDALNVDADTIDGLDSLYLLDYNNFTNTPTIPTTTTQISEGTNLYYTNARVDTRIGLANINDLADVTITTPVNGALLAYNTTGSIWEDVGTFSSQFDTALATKSTTNLTEGTNLYYTQGRFDSAFTAKSTTDLSEGTNLYYTTARQNTDFDTRLATKSTTDLSEGTNLYYTQGRFDTAFAAKTTTNLTEGTNLYYTNARVDTRIGLASIDDLADVTITTPVNGALLAYNTTGSIWEDVGTFSSQFDTALATKSTTNLTEGTNLYYTTARQNTDFDTRLSTKSTTDLSEGTNLYYTQGRFDSAFTAKSTTDLSEGTNLYYTDARVDTRIGLANLGDLVDVTITTPVNGALLAYNTTGSIWEDVGTFSSQFDTALATKSTTNLTEGTNLYYTQGRFDSAFTAKSTTDLSEGTNLYFTDERVDDRVANLLVAGTNITLTYNDVANTLTIDATGSASTTLDGLTDVTLTTPVDGALLAYDNGTSQWIDVGTFASQFDTALATKTTTNLTEGTNLYYTTARQNTDFDTRLATKSTTDLSEGTNLYFTDERVDDRVAALLVEGTNIVITYDDIANTLTIAAPGSGGGAAVLNDLTDVTITSPVNGALLAYNTTGSIWEDVGTFSSQFDTALATKSTTNLTEGTNLYYTTARQNTDFDTRLATKSTTDLAEGTNLYYTQGRFDSAFTAKSTTDLSEGTNLYYTNARVDTRIGLASIDDLVDVTITTPVNGALLAYNTTGSIWEDVGTFASQFDTALATKSTTNLTEGTNLYYTQGRFDSAFTAKSTTDLSEGTNLYFTDERVDDRVANLLVAGTDISLTYDDGANTLTIAYTGTAGSTTLSGLTDVTITTPVNGALLTYNTTGSIWEDSGTFASQFDTALATKSTTNLTEGTNLYYTQGRFDTAFTAKSTTDLSEGTNLYYTTARQNTDFDTRLATKSTTDLSEGTNLYYTDARVDTRIGLANLGDLVDVTLTTPVNGALLAYNTTGSIWEDVGTFASQFDTALATKTTTNLTEGTNLYYTTARQNTDFDTRLSTKSTTDLSEGTNLYYTQGRFDSAFTAKSTTDLSEGTNLYFTDERVDDRVNGLLVAGTDISLTYNDGANTLTIAYTGSAGATTLGGLTDVTLTTPVNGALLAYNTTGSIWEDVGTFASQFDTALATKTTTNLTEGTNLYYTQGRFDSAFTAKSTTDLSEGTNLYYTTARQNTDFDTRLATKSTTDLSEGTNLYYTDARVDTRIGLANLGDLVDVTLTTPVNGALLAYNTTGSIWEDVGTFSSQFDTALATKSTTNLTEGTNLYYTQGRFDSAFTAKSTTDLSEGTNLYYTTTRANSAIDTRVTKSFVEALNIEIDGGTY